MSEVVLLNFFQFVPLDSAAVAACPNGDAPGLLLVVDRKAPLSWAFVGAAAPDLRSRVRVLLEDPGPLREFVERGATFATCVVRDPQARAAAEAFLCELLKPAVRATHEAIPATFTFKLKFHGPADQRPAQ